VHRTDDGVLARQSVTLVGEGINKTRLLGDRGKYTLRAEGGRRFRLRDLTVEWVGVIDEDFVDEEDDGDTTEDYKKGVHVPSLPIMGETLEASKLVTGRRKR
jgi:hypothetical protein